MSEAKKYDRSYKEQSVKLALEIGVRRICSSIGGMPPAEKRRRYYSDKTGKSAVAAIAESTAPAASTDVIFLINFISAVLSFYAVS